MSTFKLKVISPEKVIFDGEVESLVVSTTEGSIGILSDHIDFFSTLIPSEIKITAKQSTESIFLDGGILDVSSKQVLIIA